MILIFVFWGERLAGHTALLGWEKARVATERNGAKRLGRNGTADKGKLPMNNLQNNLLWQRCNGALRWRLRNVENGATLAVGC